MRTKKFLLLLILSGILCGFKPALALNSWNIYYQLSHLNGDQYQYYFKVVNKGPDNYAIRRWSLSSTAIPDEWSFTKDDLKAPGDSNTPEVWHKTASGYIAFYENGDYLDQRIQPPGAGVNYAEFFWKFDRNGGKDPYSVVFKSSNFNVYFHEVGGTDDYKSSNGSVSSIPEPGSFILLSSGFLGFVFLDIFRNARKKYNK